MIFVIVVVCLSVLLVVSFVSKKKLDSKCNHLELDLKAKSEDVDNALSSKRQLEEQVAELETSIEELGDALADKDGNISNLIEKQRVTETQIDDQKKEIKRLTGIVSANDVTIAQLKAKEAELRREMLVQNEKQKVSEQRTKELAKEVERLTGIVSNNEETIAQLKGKESELHGELSVQNEKQKDSEQQAKELAKEVERLTGVISSNDETIAQLKGKETELIEEILVARKDVDTKVQELNRLQAALDDVKSQVDEKSLKLKQTEAELIASNKLADDLKAQIESKEQQAEEQESEEEQSTTESDELEFTIEQLQKANEEYSQCRRELLNKNTLLEIRGKKIEELKMELSKAKEENLRLEEELGLLKGFDSKTTDFEQESEDILAEADEIPKEDDCSNLNTEDSVEEKKQHVSGKSSKSTNSNHKGKIEEDDLPLVKIEHGVVKRSILYVNDLESSNPDEKIYADEFFKGDMEVIYSKINYLNDADKRDRNAFVCGCCGNRVKISCRDLDGNVYFFKHCKKNVSCLWQKEWFGLFGGDSGEELNEEELERFNNVKAHVLNGLRTNHSVEKGIYDVEENAVIRGKYPFMVWRRVDVCARYGDRDVVFELVTRVTHLNNLTDKDLFCRVNDYHVIWILGADVKSGYDYMRKFVPQNTMFANRRNVFFIDDETLEECERRQELVLKCNYLDPDDQWHFRKETSGNNGLFVTIDQLQFDDDVCKPYFFDANTDYFALHPEAKNEFIHCLKSREEIVEDFRKKYVERKSGGNFIDINREENLEKPQPVFKSVPCRDDRFFYVLNGKWGLVDENKNFILPCEYDKIVLWTTNKYKVLKVDLWGIYEEEKGFIIDFCFLKIEGFKNNKALVDTGSEQYYIDRRLRRISDEEIVLHGGWIKYRLGEKWGIFDKDGKVVLKCEYDEIGSFRGRLIGFINGSFQKLPQRYNYRIKIQCKCIKNENRRALFSINGVVLYYLVKRICLDGAIYKDKCIANILFPSGRIFVKDYTVNDVNKHFNIIADENTDFEMDILYSGTIVSKKQKRYYVQLFDGKRTMFNLKAIRDSGKNPEDFVIGTVVTLKKKGFDKNYDRTIWKIV